MMSEDENKTADSAPEKDFLLDLSFGPAWARRPSGQPEARHREFEAREESDARRQRGGRERFRDGDRRDRPPQRDRPPPRPDTPRADARRPGPPDRRRDFAPREYTPRAPVRISFVPEPRQLSALVRQLRAAKKAYPLPNLAGLLVSKPEYCSVKIESLDGEQRVALHACRLCRMVALTPPAIVAHVMRVHLDDFFVREETEAKLPAGQFVCVARCGLSGILLGPPNHHSYAEKLQEVHGSRFAQMPLDEYRSRIEMRREPELIEQWRSEARKRTVYRLKKAEGADAGEPLTRAAAESHLMKAVVPANVGTTVRSVLALPAALEMEDRGIRQAVREAWQREMRSPRSLLFAMRAAFRHKSLHLFRAGRDWEYVTAIDPSVLDPAHAVAPIRDILACLRERPGGKRADILAAVRPGVAADSTEAGEFFSHLAWLIEKGHIIEFFDGALASARIGAKTEERGSRAPAEAVVAAAAAATGIEEPPAARGA